MKPPTINSNIYIAALIFDIVSISALIWVINAIIQQGLNRIPGIRLIVIISIADLVGTVGDSVKIILLMTNNFIPIAWVVLNFVILLMFMIRVCFATLMARVLFVQVFYPEVQFNKNYQRGQIMAWIFAFIQSLGYATLMLFYEHSNRRIIRYASKLEITLFSLILVAYAFYCFIRLKIRMKTRHLGFQDDVMKLFLFPALMTLELVLPFLQINISIFFKQKTTFTTVIYELNLLVQQISGLLDAIAYHINIQKNASRESTFGTLTLRTSLNNAQSAAAGSSSLFTLKYEEESRMQLEELSNMDSD